MSITVSHFTCQWTVCSRTYSPVIELFVEEFIQVNMKETTEAFYWFALSVANPPLPGGFPTQRASIAEGLFMSWLLHATWIEWFERAEYRCKLACISPATLFRYQIHWHLPWQSRSDVAHAGKFSIWMEHMGHVCMLGSMADCGTNSGKRIAFIMLSRATIC